MLQLKTIHTDTFELLQKLSATEPLSSFALAGGTALALQLGHRISIDLDFLSTHEFESDVLLETLGLQFDIENCATGKNSAAMFIKFKETCIKTDFLRHNYSLLKPINNVEGVKIYALEDIAAMKLNAIANRGAKKDFYDIYSLLDCFTMETMLGLFRGKYEQRNDLTVVKSLAYFDDAELEPDPVTLLSVTWADVKQRMVQVVSGL